MSTVNDLVNRAFLVARISQAGETPDAEDSAAALIIFNRMLHSWSLDYGVDLGHTDLVLADTITLPNNHLQAVEYNLAIRLAAEYETQVNPEIVFFAQRGLRALQSVYINVPELGFDRGLRNRTSTRSTGENF